MNPAEIGSVALASATMCTIKVILVRYITYVFY